MLRGREKEGKGGEREGRERYRFSIEIFPTFSLYFRKPFLSELTNMGAKPYKNQMIKLPIVRMIIWMLYGVGL